ncbi:GNAT family N-acetyltransferase [Xanthomarina sp. GH4-25]|uniref:GNAT family N-acetyltransferase n=1 Tax=Xanthomarina sp. GH4-25 TaxID=3349335 RepID=UPI0038781E8F
MNKDLVDLLKEINIEFDNKFIKININEYVNKIVRSAVVIPFYKENQLIGFIAFYANNFETKVAYLTMLAVNKDFRSKNIGKFLLDMTTSYLIDRGFKKFGLETLTENERAKKFYLENGFLVKEKKGRFIYMEKDI